MLSFDFDQLYLKLLLNKDLEIILKMGKKYIIIEINKYYQQFKIINSKC